jgi:alkylation response protein AidB-like acyl-CoA dehydrogenase
MDGGTSFTEVFFTDVRLPASTLVGGWNDGWTVARYTLMHERFGMASRGRNASIAALQELARARGLDDDPVIRDKLVKLYVRVQLLRFLGLRLESAARRQVAPGPEGSVAKLLFGEIFDGSVELAMELLGPWGMLARGGAGAEEPTDDPYGFWQAQLLGAPSAHIAGGSDQILRNIIGERILGLPRDPRPEGATGSRSAS